MLNLNLQRELENELRTLRRSLEAKDAELLDANEQLAALRTRLESARTELEAAHTDADRASGASDELNKKLLALEHANGEKRGSRRNANLLKGL